MAHGQSKEGAPTMTGRAKNGQKGEGGRLAHDSEKKRQKPLPFIMNIVHDSAQPMALRARMAQAALPFLHKRGEDIEAEEKPKRQTLSDLELARRIAHILELGRKQAKREGKPFPEIGGEDIASKPAPSGPPLTPPANAGQSRRMPPAPAWPEDERAQHNDPFDPHPGYRWI